MGKKKRIVQVLMLFLALGVFLVVVGGLGGRSLTGIWVGENAAISNSIMCVFGLYFSLSCVFHLFTLSLYAMRLKYACVLANALTALMFCFILISVDSVDVFGAIISASTCLTAVGIPICLASFYLSNSRVGANGVARSLY